MNKPREFWIEETLVGQEKEPWYLRSTPATGIAAKFVHVREVTPEDEALKEKLTIAVEALKRIKSQEESSK